MGRSYEKCWCSECWELIKQKVDYERRSFEIDIADKWLQQMTFLSIFFEKRKDKSFITPERTYNKTLILPFKVQIYKLQPFYLWNLCKL